MAKRRSARKGVLDWWQTVLDETKDLVDDGLDRLRDDDDDDDDLAKEVADLKRSPSSTPSSTGSSPSANRSYRAGGRRRR